jgi:hypothetical protein
MLADGDTLCARADAAGARLSPSVVPRRGAAAVGSLLAPRTLMVVATEITPRHSPAAAAATIVQRERERRRERVELSCSSSGSRLATTGASLGGGSDSTTGASDSADGAGATDHALCATGGREAGGSATNGGGGELRVGMARRVTFSLKLIGAGSLGGGGGKKLERATGMSLDSGLSPPRTTTACRGGGFKPGRAMKPPRGVIHSRDGTGPEGAGLSSSGGSLERMANDSTRFCRDFWPRATKVAVSPTSCVRIG